MATAASTKTLRMKLLIDTKAQRVLFAEAGKDVVDFLFSLLALPVATAVKLVGKDSVAGSVGNLFSSVERLHSSYIVPGADKAALLRPAAVSPAATANSPFFLMPAAPSSGGGGGGQSSKVFFQCVRGSSNCGCPTGYGYGGYGGGSDCSLNVTDAYGITCPNCGDSVIRTLPLKYVSSGQNTFTGGGGGSASGFVQGVVTYTVKDDLTITPMSAISSIMLLNAFGVTDLTTLKEKTVKLGYVEGVQILRASLQSKTVLTDVFLGKEQGTRRA